MFAAEMMASVTRGQLLRRLRKARGLGIVELSEIAGVDKGAISRAENDNPNTSYDTLWKLAKTLGVTVEYLERGGPDEGTSPVTLPPDPPRPSGGGGGRMESAKQRLLHLVASLTEEESVVLLMRARLWLADLARRDMERRGRDARPRPVSAERELLHAVGQHRR